MRLSDYTVTEAGFGADLGAEKFINIKCRKAGPAPRRGGDRGHGPRAEAPRRRAAEGRCTSRTSRPSTRAWRTCEAHREHPPLRPAGVVAINHFTSDTDAEEIQFIKDKCASLSREDHHGQPLGRRRRRRRGTGPRRGADVVEKPRPTLRFVYATLHALAEGGHHRREIYGATDVLADKKLREQVPQACRRPASATCPICMAKTQYSLLDRPAAARPPEQLRRAAARRDGCRPAPASWSWSAGDIMTMPGLPKVPAAETIDIDAQGRISGLS